MASDPSWWMEILVAADLTSVTEYLWAEPTRGAASCLALVGIIQLLVAPKPPCCSDLSFCSWHLWVSLSGLPSWPLLGVHVACRSLQPAHVVMSHGP